MRLLKIIFFVAALAGCTRPPKLPDGITLRVMPSKDVVIYLDDSQCVQVRQNKPDHRIALIANTDGNLQLLQLEQGGAIPRSMKLISQDKAEISVNTISKHTGSLIIDENGDGIPDTKIEGNKKFKCTNIEWTEIQRFP